MTVQYTIHRPHALEELVGDIAARHPALFGRHIDLNVDGNELFLTGTVRSYYDKQMAQETFLQTSGLRRVHNQLQVVR